VPQSIDPEFRSLLADAPGIGRLVSSLQVTALDIGARRGFADDLLPIAKSVNAIGFEPDEAECARLNDLAARDHSPWRSLSYIPVAVGPEDTDAKLNLYKQRGCSSFLAARQDVVEAFGRADDYVLEDIVAVPMTPLDSAARDFGFEDAAFLKMDVQGFESAILSTAPKLLKESILAIRTEVSFAPVYLETPLLEDILRELRSQGFFPASFEELHSWRRGTRVKHPRRASGPLPFSQGQLVHGDLLLFRDPGSIRNDAEALTKTALIAISYGHLDFARTLLTAPVVTAWLQDRIEADILVELRNISGRFGRLLRRGRRQQIKDDLAHTFRRFVFRGVS
jgi:FkbM family methyltransferase